MNSSKTPLDPSFRVTLVPAEPNQKTPDAVTWNLAGGHVADRVSPRVSLLLFAAAELLAEAHLGDVRNPNGHAVPLCDDRGADDGEGGLAIHGSQSTRAPRAADLPAIGPAQEAAEGRRRPAA